MPAHGDTIFYTSPGASEPHHIVIYLGGNRILQAPQTGENVDYATRPPSLTRSPPSVASASSAGHQAHLTVVTNPTASHPAALMSVFADGVYPDLHGVGGADQLKAVIGALMTIVLIVAVLMIVVCSTTWAVSSSHGNYHLATRARTGLMVAIGAAALDGAAIAWLNFLLRIGPIL